MLKLITGISKIELLIYETNSLKEKRMILKSLIGRLQSKFNLSIAETGNHELWQRAEIGIACVTKEIKHANHMIDAAIHFIDNDGRVEIIRQETEYVSS